jgi:hypothetical protein
MIRFGLHMPYDARPTEATWQLLLRGVSLDLKAVVITSHEPDQVFERLHAMLPPDAVVYLRLKGNRWFWPATAPLDGFEWQNETTPRQRIQWLVDRGRLVKVILWNEPDIELPKDGEKPGGGWWANDDAERLRAWHLYYDAADRAIKELQAAWSGTVGISLAPLSQGDPGRYLWWAQRYAESGLWDRCTFRAEHAYTNGLPPEHAEWGGRWINCSSGADWPLPVAITECDTNNQGGDRPGQLARYAAWLTSLPNPPESLCLFILPGGARDDQQPSWWRLDQATIEAVGQALDRVAPPVPTPPPTPEPTPAPPPPPLLPATLDSLRALRWGALQPEVLYNPETAIAKFWLEHPELGSVLSGETPLDDGTIGQVFAGGIVQWDAQNGARLV